MTAIVTWAKEALRLGDITFIIVVLAVGAVLLFLRPRWGRRWIVTMALAYWFVSTPLGSGLISAPLMRGFHSIEDVREADRAGAIVVLGGGVRELTARAVRLAYPYESSTLRILEAVRLFRLLEGRPFVVASGGIAGKDQQTAEADVIAEALVKLGVPQGRIIIERASRTTSEQSMFVTQLLKARGIERFVLVTSPTHMSRSVAAFRAQHADVVPSIAALVPERSQPRLFFMPNGESLEISDSAVYDYAGLVYYSALGRFRPAPASETK